MNRDSSFETPRHPVRLVANRTGLSPHVLRAWERRYGVVAPHRSEGGQRLYSDQDVERLRQLRQLTARGHSISRIATLSLAELERLEAEAPPAPAMRPDGAVESSEAAELVAEALRAVRALDADELQAVLQRAAVTLGGPLFLDEVVAPAVEAVGDGWAGGSLSVAQEHMSSAVFRRVLEWLVGVYRVEGEVPRLVVATPPGQAHEIGALMVAACAAAEGWGITYLGPDLPVADLLAAVRETRRASGRAQHRLLLRRREVAGGSSAARRGLPEGTPLLVGGAAASGLRGALEDLGAIVLDSLPELRARLREMGEAE